MKIGLVFLFIVMLSFGLIHSQQNCPSRKLVVCYWASWSIFRPGNGSQKISHIISQYCTHIVYSFTGLSFFGEIESLDITYDIENGGYKNFLSLKEHDPCLKLLVAIGGWTDGSEKYSLMSENAKNRDKFADSVLRFLVFYGFDGIDIDWEYPTKRGGLPSDKENFVYLLKTLREKLKNRNRLITAAVSASIEIVNSAYNIPQMCKYLDFISIMGYDLHFTNTTSLHSLIRTDSQNQIQQQQVIDDVIQIFKRNCPGEKIVLGVPAYGRSYTLLDEQNTTIGAPVIGIGKAGNLTREEGFFGFNEICEMQKKQKGWTTISLSKSMSSYAWKNKLWLSYDNEINLQQKAEYVLNEKLGGIMVWSIDTDDFRGICSGVQYPLLTAINKGFKNNISFF